MNQSDSDVELEKEFKKFRLEEITAETDEESAVKTCNCASSVIIRSSLLELSVNNKLKTKDRRSTSLIKPARLKFIGNCYAKNKATTDEEVAKKVEDFTSDAFLKMRITPTATTPPPSRTESPEKPSTSSLNCSTQAKLQQQMSSTEFDSTIDEMSDFLAYHLSLFNRRDKFLIDSMYT